MTDKEKEDLTNVICNHLLERYLEDHPDEFKAFIRERITERPGEMVPWITEWDVTPIPESAIKDVETLNRFALKVLGIKEIGT